MPHGVLVLQYGTTTAYGPTNEFDKGATFLETLQLIAGSTVLQPSDIVNVSFGSISDDWTTPAFEAAVESVEAAGIIPVMVQGVVKTTNPTIGDSFIAVYPADKTGTPALSSIQLENLAAVTAATEWAPSYLKIGNWNSLGETTYEGGSFTTPIVAGCVQRISGFVRNRDGAAYSVEQVLDYVLSACERQLDASSYQRRTGGALRSYAPWSALRGYGDFSGWKALLFAAGYGRIAAQDAVAIAGANNPITEFSDDYELRGDLHVEIGNSLRVSGDATIAIVPSTLGGPEGPQSLAGTFGEAARHDLIVSGILVVASSRIPSAPFPQKAGVNVSVVVDATGSVTVKNGGTITISADQVLEIHPGGSVTIESGGAIIIEPNGLLEIFPGDELIEDPGSTLDVQSGGLDLRPFDNASEDSGISIPQGSTPYASTPVDYDADGDEDLLISYTDIGAQLQRNDGVSGDMASFQDLAFLFLGGGTVGNTKGVNRLDYSNDGAVDLFFASSSGSRLFKGSKTSPGDLNTEQTSVLGAAATAASSAAAWGDFNRDGVLDVYVVRDSSDVLLEAQTDAFGNFIGYADVTSSMGLHTNTAATNSAMWADLDNDGWQDLFVTWGAEKNAASNEYCFYYHNGGPDPQGNVSFTDVVGQSTGPGIGDLGRSNSVDFADLNGDGFLDLILAREEPTPFDFFPNLLVCFNDGTGGLRVEPDPSFGITNDEDIADVEITDLDGNGVLDILAVPKLSTLSPIVHYGRFDAGLPKYTEGSASTGMGTGTTFGLSIADFNADSDPDVLLLRPETGSSSADKNFLFANPRFTGEERFLTVSFPPLTKGLNSLGLGASVTLEVTTPSSQQLSSTQVVDGGSGKGGQGSGKLVFGLGGASTASVTVRWPHGVVQNFADASALPGFPNLVLDYSVDPQIDASSITDTYNPGENVIHKIKWITALPGGAPEVLLLIASPASGTCKLILDGQNSKLLKAGVPGVSATSKPVAAGWEHTVTYATSCFAVCNYIYTVRNVVGGTIYASSNQTLNVNVCGGFGE